MVALLAFLLGATLGSFLNVVVDRLPEGRSIVRGRSHCDSCQKQLASRDLAPILSYLLLKGRCRYCRARIPGRVLVVEAITGALFLGLSFQFGLGYQFAVLSVAASVMVVVVMIDWERQLILDVITYPCAVAALALSPFWSHLDVARTFWGHEGVLWAFLNALTAGAGLGALFAAIATAIPGGMGWGDVKLAFVAGLLLGYPAGVAAVWLGMVAGGFYGLWLIVVRRKGRKEPIPYGPFLAGGVIVMLFAQGQVAERYHSLTAGFLVRTL